MTKYFRLYCAENVQRIYSFSPMLFLAKCSEFVRLDFKPFFFMSHCFIFIFFFTFLLNMEKYWVIPKWINNLKKFERDSIRCLNIHLILDNVKIQHKIKQFCMKIFQLISPSSLITLRKCLLNLYKIRIYSGRNTNLFFFFCLIFFQAMHQREIEKKMFPIWMKF